ncbi:hypothetical protein [Oceanobacillus sp. CF4.6]|uniref:hypothetical protein n=1 Tax=Oceanobacillus sp. CF4.6 TaxID=3373080 RepID=UPI003EE79130
MNNSYKDTPPDIGDRLLYYGGMLATIGSVIAFVGSTIIYESEFSEPSPLENERQFTMQQFNQMQKQIDDLQKKMDQIQNGRNP